MAEVFDFGLQQHKIKMDGKFFENNLFAVAGDTGRRLEVQLLDSDNLVQNTTGISLRLNAEVAGKSTYAVATLVDATQGLYELDLPNGMLLAPGNWQFQWQIIGSNGEKLHSFAFMGTIGSNLAEGAAEGLNFYLNLEVLKQMQEDLVNGTFDSEVLETNIAEKLTDLETQYAPRLTEVTAQLAKTNVNKADQEQLNQLKSIVDSLSTDNADGLKDAELMAIRTNKTGRTFETATERVTSIETLIDLTSAKKTAMTAFATRYRKFDGNTINQSNDTYASLYYDVKEINAIFINSTKTRAMSNIYTLLDKKGRAVYWKRNDTNYEADYSNLFVDTSEAETLIISVTEGNQSLVSVDSYFDRSNTIEELDVILKRKKTEVGFYQNGTKILTAGNILDIYNVEAFDYLNLSLAQVYAKNAFTLLDSNFNVIRYSYVDSTTKAFVMSEERIYVGDAIYLAVSYVTKPAPVVKAKVNKSDLLLNYDLLNPIKYEKGFYQHDTGVFVPTLGKKAIWYSVKSTDKVYINYLSPAYTNIYTLMDENFKPLKVLANNTANNVSQNNVEVDVSDSTYLIINPIETEEYTVYGLRNYNLENTERNNFLTGSKTWKNKKIVWFGTSIPAGGLSGIGNIRSYPMMIGERLGATVFNESVGSSSVHCKKPENITTLNPYGFNNNFENVSRCLTNTVVEMQWIIDNYKNGVFTQGVPSTLSQTDKDFILSCSYENKLVKHLDGSTDLFVFDHGHNDGIGVDDDSYSGLYGKDNLYCFEGAMNFLVRKIKNYNPKSKIVMIGEYENQKTSLVPPKQTKVADSWNIPLYKQWEKLGWSQEKIKTDYNWVNNKWTYTGNLVEMTLLQSWIPDNLHPHTDYDGRALTHITDNMVAWFMSEVR